MRHAREGELTARQEKAIIALINETTVARAAQTSGIGERTLHRWLQDDAFVDAYRRARREAFGQAIALTQRYAPMAVTTLAKVMNDPVAPHTARVSAASAMLKFGREGIEMDDLAARLERLEATSASQSR
jgi:hypothetical protein